MKTFKEICRMSQSELKSYMHKYLSSKKYSVINEDGFLYAKGTVPVLLVAHMDTVHHNICTTITEINDRISSPQGIGGDDRCGIFIIMNLIRELNCSVLLCEDEEIGAIGATKFTKTAYINNLDVNYIIEFDRRGNNDAVFYGCDNKEFTEFVTSTTGFKEAFGSFSDISKIAPAAKIAAVNLSSGYYNAHTLQEYVDYTEMMDTVEAAMKLITTETKAFEYVQKTYNYNSYSLPSSYYNGSNYQPKQLSFSDYCITKDFEIELEVVWYDENGDEVADSVSGSTKAEAWALFFMNNPDVCFSMIVDYSFC